MSSSNPLPCSFFAEGRCKAGSSCRFAHVTGVAKPASVQQPCRFFEQGYCKSGKMCPFLHEDKTAKPAAPRPQNNAPLARPAPRAGAAGGGGAGVGAAAQPNAWGAPAASSAAQQFVGDDYDEGDNFFPSLDQQDEGYFYGAAGIFPQPRK
jgi:hypothetical protein